MTKGKLALLLVVAVVIVAGALAYAGTAAGGGSAKGVGPVGRFQVVAGDYSVLSSGDGHGATDTYHGVFLVDTQTGRIWERTEGMEISKGATMQLEWWHLVHVQGIEESVPSRVTVPADRREE